jgi:hypothetical protein
VRGTLAEEFVVGVASEDLAIGGAVVGGAFVESLAAGVTSVGLVIG